MQFLKDRRVLLAAGGLIALFAGLGLAWTFMAQTPAATAPPPAVQGGLIVVTGRDDDAKIGPNQPLRCFVGGQFVGELPLSVCAQRNGVATGALDVGLDPSGALAASNGAGTEITPLPPQEPPLSQPLTEPGAANAAANATDGSDAALQTADCQRYVAGAWKKLAGPMTLGDCVQAVFGGRCSAAGQPPLYGYWGAETLRLQDGRVDISADGADFRGFMDAWPGCQTRGVQPAPRAAPPANVGSRP